MGTHKLDDLRLKLGGLLPELNEKQKRYIAGLEAIHFGWGGVKKLSEITGLSEPTIRKGVREAKGEIERPAGIRKTGGGRKSCQNYYPKIVKEIESIVDEETRGDPETHLRWTCKSVRNIADALSRSGIVVSYRTVNRLLHEMEFSLKGNKKTKEGKSHPDRDQQFRYINRMAKKALKKNIPAISVDAKKKELVGNYKNPGLEWSKKGKTKDVNSHDFPIAGTSKATPFGVFDLNENKGWVNVGISADTGEFAVSSIKKWWTLVGKKGYSTAKELLVFADAGGSNGYRLRLWKVELQKMCNAHDLKITVCHFPPGTSKWNKIEHRLFSFISINWRGVPLSTYQIIIDLISSTTTRAGLTVKARLDKKKYKRGIKISDSEMRLLNIYHHEFHGEWNYTISPKK